MTSALIVAALALSAPTVDVMVVGKERVLHTGEVRLKQRGVKVAGRRCRVGARTPLSVLAGTRLRLRLRDYGRCSRRPRDASGLYVRGVRREVERGRAGWVYKVGRRAGTAGAGDPSVRGGRHVTWFWCVRAGDCQRTLEVRPERTAVAPGEALRVTVRGYDDLGRGVPVEGATVRLGTATALTGPDGTATLVAGSRTGRVDLEAERDGMVPAFPRQVRVG
ncbi:MAG: hypothetical protein ACRDPC_22405 [Solirubrobacteraceae bacterium]